MTRKVVLVILLAALLIGVVAVLIQSGPSYSDWKAEMSANHPTKEPCVTCPTLSPKDPNWQKDLGGTIKKMRDADAWWKALPSDPWTLDKSNPPEEKAPARPRGPLIPHYTGPEQKAV